MERSPEAELPKLSKVDKGIAWAIWMLVLAFLASLIFFVIFPWSIASPDASAYGSSLRRSTDLGGTGNCEVLDRDRGTWSCAITGPSDYLPFVLWESGDEGCWVAQMVGSRWTEVNAYRGCAGTLDAIGIAHSDDPVYPLPGRVKARALAGPY